MTNTYLYLLAGQIPATTPAVGIANAKPFDFTCYGKLGMYQTYLILHATANTGLQQREAVRRTGSIGSSGSPLREEPEQRGITATTPAAGKANVKLSLLLFACYDQLGFLRCLNGQFYGHKLRYLSFSIA